MTNLPISDASQHLPEIANRVAYGGERVMVTRRGKQLFAIVPAAHAELLDQLEDAADLDTIRQRLREKTRSWAKVKKDLGI